jgi:hypothetical protein
MTDPFAYSSAAAFRVKAYCGSTASLGANRKDFHLYALLAQEFARTAPNQADAANRSSL